MGLEMMNRFAEHIGRTTGKNENISNNANAYNGHIDEQVEKVRICLLKNNGPGKIDINSGYESRKLNSRNWKPSEGS